MTRGLRIAMLGTRGVPATYGGIERHIEEIGARLAERGHEVTVYARSQYLVEPVRGTYRGMHVVVLPVVGGKHLEALTHTLVASVVSAFRRHDIHHFHAIGPGMMTPVTRLIGGGRTVLTVHGLDYDRAKWSTWARRFMLLAERVGARAAHSHIVVAQDLQEHYAAKYGLTATYIRNGVALPDEVATSKPDSRRVLAVGRMTPEKGLDLLVKAFAQLDGADLRLDIVGGSSHTDRFVTRISDLAAADPRVALHGYLYGPDLEALFTEAQLFVQPSLIEGMPLTLLEAAARGLPLIASDIAVHLQVMGPDAQARRTFRSGSVDALARVLRVALDVDPQAEREAAAAFALQIRQQYSWDDVTDEVEAHYMRLVSPRSRRSH